MGFGSLAAIGSDRRLLFNSRIAAVALLLLFGDAFKREVAQTYNFNQAGMNENQIAAQSKELDVFWNKVKESRATLVPCLRQALKESHSGSFFAIDGSMLLVDVDPSRASKALQLRKFVEADLDGTDLEYWVTTMARRGVEGFDTSAAGEKWLAYPKAQYRRQTLSQSPPRFARRCSVRD